MCGKAVAALAGNNSQGWVEGQDELMTWKDYLTCARMKIIIEEKEMNLQELHISIPVSYYIVSENYIKILNPNADKKKQETKLDIKPKLGNECNEVRNE